MKKEKKGGSDDEELKERKKMGQRSLKPINLKPLNQIKFPQTLSGFQMPILVEPNVERCGVGVREIARRAPGMPGSPLSSLHQGSGTTGPTPPWQCSGLSAIENINRGD